VGNGGNNNGLSRTIPQLRVVCRQHHESHRYSIPCCRFPATHPPKRIGPEPKAFHHPIMPRPTSNCLNQENSHLFATVGVTKPARLTGYKEQILPCRRQLLRTCFRTSSATQWQDVGLATNRPTGWGWPKGEPAPVTHSNSKFHSQFLPHSASPNSSTFVNTVFPYGFLNVAQSR